MSTFKANGASCTYLTLSGNYSVLLFVYSQDDKFIKTSTGGNSVAVNLYLSAETFEESGLTEEDFRGSAITFEAEALYMSKRQLPGNNGNPAQPIYHARSWNSLDVTPRALASEYSTVEKVTKPAPTVAALRAPATPEAQTLLSKAVTRLAK